MSQGPAHIFNYPSIVAQLNKELLVDRHATNMDVKCNAPICLNYSMKIQGYIIFFK